MAYAQFHVKSAMQLTIMVFCSSLVYLLRLSLYQFRGSIVEAVSHVSSPLDVFQMLPKFKPFAIYIYACWFLFQVFLYVMLPSKKWFGRTTDAGNLLEYNNVNGIYAWIVSHIAFLSGVYLGLWNGGIIYDYANSFLYITTVLGVLGSFGFLFKGFFFPTNSDVFYSGNPIYDYFAGIELNPRIGSYDIKLFLNGRPGIVAWTMINLSMAFKQYELYGQVTNSMILVNIIHQIYVLDFFYHEGWYLGTIDIIHERLGWFLCFGDLVWLPFMYTLQCQYLVENPIVLPTPFLLFLYALTFSGYYIFRTANNQKDFARRTKGMENMWGKKPDVINATYKTPNGTTHNTLILASGWWGISRHFNYVGDLMMCWAMCLACGTEHILPYFYVVFMIILLSHRAWRDDIKCLEKYGRSWELYMKKVPYRILPYFEMSVCADKQRIKVYVRTRPALPNELEVDDAENCVKVLDDKTIVVGQDIKEDKTFAFDGVFGPSHTNNDVFQQVAKETIDDVFKGYHSTILMYGQTGSGKTHTIGCKREDDLGIIPRTIQYIYDRIGSDSDHEYAVCMNYIQIYMEMIGDLLNSESKNLQIREDPSSGVYLAGVTDQPIESAEELMNYYTIGDECRETNSTKLNASSSRSHACLIINIEKRRKFTRKDYESENSEEVKGRHVTRANLFLVDLAGSERLKKTEATGMRKVEAGYINLSLANLGNVVQALSKKQSHIPYRDSKLTRLLQESLGGNGKTRIIVTIGPSSVHSQESIGTLLFGQRAMKVKNVATINETIDYKALALKLQSQLDTMEVEFREQTMDLEEMVEENEVLEKKYKSNVEVVKQLTVNLAKVESEKQAVESLVKGDVLNAEVKYQQVNDALEKKCAELTASFTAQCELLENKVKEKDTEIQHMNFEVMKKDKTIENLTTELAELTQSETHLKKSMEQLEKSVQDHTLKNCSLEYTLEQLQSANQTLNEKITSQDEQYQSVVDQNSKLSQDKVNLEHKLDASEKKIAEGINTIESLTLTQKFLSEDKAQLEQKTINLKHNIQTLKEQISKVEQDKQSIIDEKSQLSNLLESTKQDLSSLKGKTISQECVMEERQKSIDHLNNLISLARTDMQEQSAELKVMRQTNENLMKNMDQLHSEKSILENKNNELLLTMQQTEHDMSSAGASALYLQKEVDQLQQENEKIEARSASLESRLRDQEVSVSSLVGLLQGNKSHTEQIESELSKASQENKSLLEDCKKFEIKTMELHNQVQNTLTQLNTTTSQLNQVTNQRDSLADQVTTMNNQVSSLQVKISELNNSHQVNDQKYKSAQEELINQQSTITNLNQTIQHMISSTSQRDQELIQSNQKIQVERDRADHIALALENARQEQLQSTQQLSCIISEKNQLADQINSLNEEIETTRITFEKECEKLKMEMQHEKNVQVGQLQDELDQLQSLQQENTQTMMELQNQNQQMQQDKLQLETNLQVIGCKNESLEEEIDNTRARYNQSVQKISEMSNQLLHNQTSAQIITAKHDSLKSAVCLLENQVQEKDHVVEQLNCKMNEVKQSLFNAESENRIFKKQLSEILGKVQFSGGRHA
ncbi:7-dehydrocholesterol reductase [Acrasis kona]|uniref:7-dehydrocholesterol reductase n=1 Tax=Acrasis kona TaxID=1008807 RepID=A0AAW2ZP72_9EUKA